MHMVRHNDEAVEQKSSAVAIAEEGRYEEFGVRDALDMTVVLKVDRVMA